MPGLRGRRRKACVPAIPLRAWLCEFYEEDGKTVLPRTVLLSDDKKLFEMLKRGGYTLNIAGRHVIEEAVRKKSGGVWLDLTGEQLAKLIRLRA